MSTDNLPIAIQTAKEELVRINTTLQQPKLLIGGLAVQRYVTARDSKDIDIVCTHEEAQSLIRELYPTDLWDVQEVNDDDYRPSFLITHQYKNIGEIIIGPKITERTPYKFINWEELYQSAYPYKFQQSNLNKILIPTCSGLAYTKLIAFLGRNATHAQKRLNDLQDLVDLSNHSEFSSRDFLLFIKKNDATEYVRENFILNDNEKKVFRNSLIDRLKAIFTSSESIIIPEEANLPPIDYSKANELKEKLRGETLPDKKYIASLGICRLENKGFGVSIHVICDPPDIPDHLRIFFLENTEGYCKISISTELTFYMTHDESIKNDTSICVGTHIFSPGIGGSGLLGGFLLDAKSNSVFLLSCDHIIGYSSDTENISKYAGVYAGTPENIEGSRKIAEDLVLSPLEDSPLALARLLPEIAINHRLFKKWKIKDVISEYHPLLIENKTVLKVGRRNEVTSGVISEFSMSMSLLDKGKHIRYDNILVVHSSSEEPFSLPGDSGSLVITENGEIVGLVFAGTISGTTYVAPLYPLLQALDLTLLSYEE
jgi:hypothetical protein